MRIYLIRHGQTTGDVEDRYGGTYDDHLTNLGKQQSEERAKKLVGLSIEAIFASPKIRAQEAAEIIAEQLSLPIIIVDALRERNFYGVLSGMVKSEAKEKHPDIVALLEDVHNTLPEGEPYNELGTRITDALRTIGNSPHETVAAVTHGGPISFIFRDILKKGEVKVDDCACVTLESGIDGSLTLIETDGITYR